MKAIKSFFGKGGTQSADSDNQVNPQANRSDKVEEMQIDGDNVKGYKYADDKISNIIDYCFGNTEDQDNLKKINEEAQKIQDLQKRKEYIEDNLKDHAKKIDKNIAQGLVGNLKSVQELYQQQVESGKIKRGEPLEIDQSAQDSTKAIMFGIMKKNGLNINEDNFKVNYQESPDGKNKVMRITFVNRPTADLANNNSVHHDLAKTYAQTLSPEQQSQFNQEIANHSQNAKTGGPIIPTAEFNKNADEKFQKDFKDICMKNSSREIAEKITSKSDGHGRSEDALGRAMPSRSNPTGAGR